MMRRLMFAYGLAWVVIAAIVGLRMFPQVEKTFAPASDTSASSAAAATYSVDLIFWDVKTTALGLIVFYVVALGILGAGIQALRAVADHKPKKVGADDSADDWDSRYTMWYLGLPFFGGTNALFFYVVLGAGFVGAFDNIEQLNVFGVSAIAIFAGLFSQKVFKKLAQVFDVVFSLDEATQEAAKKAAETIAAGSSAVAELGKTNEELSKQVAATAERATRVMNELRG